MRVRIVVGIGALLGAGALVVAALALPSSREAPDDAPEHLVEFVHEADEGARAKKEEGKIGKKEARMEKAKGNTIEVKKLEVDRQVAETAGVLGSLGEGGLGTKGVGLGGGGGAQGLGGLGTKGVGSGASGFGAGWAPDPVSAEEFTDHGISGVVMVAADPLSTFSVDVDTGSYTIARRKLAQGTLPPEAAVRVEEFVNYLPYGYAPPTDAAPVAAHLEAVPHPFSPDRTLLRVGIAARELPERDRKPVHLVFLVDVSGSMRGPDRLPLAKQALRWMVDHLGPEDTVAMATYAGFTQIALEPTPTTRRAEIHEAIEGLDARGSTAMNSGLELAYLLASRDLLPGCENRVIVLSDGDANVGPAGLEANLRTIRSWAGKGITLSTVGFGTGNYKDTLMEQLADQGDGNYLYVDSFTEAKRVFGEKLAGTVHTVARDVKLQVEFSPSSVVAYRLVGYENRDLADRDFRNDAVDAGEIGSGQQVTALYELVLAERPQGPLATVRFRAKPPGREAAAREWTTTLGADSVKASFDQASVETRIALAAATTAELLRGSPHVAEVSWDQVAALVAASARQGVPEDLDLLALVSRAAELAGAPVVAAR